MYEVSVRQHFDAAHYLRDYQGKCEKVHGHRFEVVVKVQAHGLNNIGLAYDFTELKSHLQAILEPFDHACLNDLPPFDNINPSSENIATTIYGQLHARLSALPVVISKVEVWESPEAWVSYTAE
ncbi:MAG: 6-carboxytetrahydropterin synthase QueD [Chloroflexi bacterium]|nr:6-carboxytetrahydropterin synthase QueD [Chloroflexota bacterium]